MTHAQEAAARALRLVGEVQAFGLLSAVTVVDRYLQVVERAVGPHRPAAPLGAVTRLLSEGAGADWCTRTMEVVELPPARPGSTSQASVWVHNPTAAPATAGLSVAQLVGAGGRCIPAEAVSLVPEQPILVAAGGRGEVLLRVGVPPATAAGHYHGLVVMSPVVAEPVALRLEVLDAKAPA